MVEQIVNIEKIFINNYGKDFDTVKMVEEKLSSIKECGFFKGSLNLDIYYEYFLANNSKGNIVISHGFSECIDKYYELIYYFLELGYSVFILEHRGHGRSGHLGKTHKSQVHIEKFEYYVEDFKIFIDNIVKKFENSLYLLAHSMGGAVGTLFLEKYNNYFEKAVLSSPMMEINTGNTKPFIARILAKGCSSIGMGGKYILGHKPFDDIPNLEESGAKNIHRYSNHHKRLLEKVELQRSGGTFNWLAQGFKATDMILDKNNIRNINAKIVLFQSGNDSFVRPTGHENFKSMLGNKCELIKFESSKHEIFYDEDEILKQYLSKIISFFYSKILSNY